MYKKLGSVTRVLFCKAGLSKPLFGFSSIIQVAGLSCQGDQADRQLPQKPLTLRKLKQSYAKTNSNYFHQPMSPPVSPVPPATVVAALPAQLGL